jgi:hypothetical protein
MKNLAISHVTHTLVLNLYYDVERYMQLRKTHWNDTNETEYYRATRRLNRIRIHLSRVLHIISTSRDTMGDFDIAAIINRKYYS